MQRITIIALLTISLISITGCTKSKSWIGETKARLIERFGQPVETAKDEKGDEVLKFKTEDYNIQATFRNGRDFELSISKQKGCCLTDDEIRYLLSQNNNGYEWEGHYQDMGGFYQEEWRRSDGKAKAIYNRILLNEDALNIIHLDISNQETEEGLRPKNNEVKEPLTITDQSTGRIAFSPDGKILASSGGQIKLWDVQTGELKQTLTQTATMSVNSVVFSPDGKTLASGSNDKTIMLWDVQTGVLGLTLTSSYVFSIAFSPDGKTLASGHNDKMIRLWDVQTGTLKQTLTQQSNYVESVAFSPDGKTLVSSGSDPLKLWDAQMGALKQTLPIYHASVAFSPDGKTLASGGGSGSDEEKIKLWDVQTGKLKQIIELKAAVIARERVVYSIAFSPDGKTLANSVGRETIELWDVQTGVLKQTLTHRVSAEVEKWAIVMGPVVFSPDGKTLASSRYSTIKLWDVSSLK